MKNDDIELDYSVDLLNLSPSKQNQLRTETTQDHQLKCLSQMITQGWPEDIKSVPIPARDFWSYRDVHTIQNGIILKGQQVLIPEAVREDILQQLHASHLGIAKTRQSVFGLASTKTLNNCANPVLIIKSCNHNNQSSQ